MMVRRTFTVFAAIASATAGAASARENSQQTQLGVTATVVRPVEIIGFPISTDGVVAIIRDTASVDVVVDGGTVDRRGGAARTAVWGDGLGATSNVSTTGTLVDLPVYGRIPAQQNVPANSYADTITITVVY